MAKIKMKKKSTSTDMTAMCDVAFLLLTFFILTATAKVPEALPVDTPASTVQTKLPETDLATITIGKGKVFFDLKGREVRKRALQLMGEKYGVTFTQEEMDKVVGKFSENSFLLSQEEELQLFIEKASEFLRWLGSK